MNALHEIRVDNFHLEAHIAVVAKLLWAWIDSNRSKRVRLKVWIFTKTFTIEELIPVFELLLGPKPAQVVSR